MTSPAGGFSGVLILLAVTIPKEGPMRDFVIIKAQLDGPGDLFPEPHPSTDHLPKELIERIEKMTPKEIEAFAKATVRTPRGGFKQFRR